MKKTMIVSGLSLLFLLTASAVAYGLRRMAFSSAWIPLAIGAGLLVLSGIGAFFAKAEMIKNLVCFCVSAVALGFCICAWYIFRGFDNAFYVIALVSVACIAYLWIFYALSRIPFFERHFNLFFWIFYILSFIAYVLIVIFTKTTYVSTFGYYMLIEMAFIYALCSDSENIQDLVRRITLATYSVFAVAVLIAVFMLSESGGDIDMDFDLKVSSVKKRRPPHDDGF